ncbi:axoneme-associated protein mst101(2) [Plutella xylostella]|uniref:axoneme-associated protein mst101(2) n=1 Tax=Plutella xylostella TaxID=51655 RepID=UPI0020330890|nr:axoneme-associated protein mst101(2) [Plutella xylostella]
MKLRKNTKAARSIDSTYKEWPKESYSKEPSAISIRFKKSSKIILKERVIPRPETQKLLQQILQSVQQKPKFKNKFFRSTNVTKSIKYKTYRKDSRFGNSKSTSVQVCFLDNLKNNNCDFVSCLRDILFADETAASSDLGFKEPKLHHKKLRIHISQSSRPNSAMEDQERRNCQEQHVSQRRGKDKIHQPSVSPLKVPRSTEENVPAKSQKDKCNINMKFKNMVSGLTSFLEPLIFDPTLESEAVCLVDKQEEPDPSQIKRRTEKKTKNRRKTASATTKEDYLKQENNIKIYDSKDDDVDNVQYTSCLKSYGSGEKTGIMKKPTKKQNDFIFPEATSSVMRAKKQEKNPCSQYQNRKGKDSKENNMKNKKGKKPSCTEEKPKKEPKKGNKNKKKGPPCLEEEEIITREKPPCQDYAEEEDDPLCQIPECKRELIEKLFEDCYEKTEGQCGLKPCCTIPPCKREQVRKLLSPMCTSDTTIATEKDKFADSSDEHVDTYAKEIPKPQLELIQKMIEKSIEEKQSPHSQRVQISTPTSCKQSCLSTPWATTNMSMSQRTTETTPGLSRPSSESRLDHDPVPGCPRSCIKLPPPEPECVEDCPSRKKEKKSYCAQKRDEGNSKETKKSFCAEKRGKIKPCDDDCKPVKEAGHCEDDCPGKPKKTKRVTHKVTQSDDSISTRSGKESPVYMTHTRSHRNVSTRARRESPIHSPRRSEYIEYRDSESDTRRSSPSNSSRQKSTTSKTKETPAPATNKKVEKSASSDTDKEKRIICSHESPLCSRCSSKVNANKESSNSEVSKSNKDSSYCNLKTPCCSCSDIKSQKEELPCLKCRDRPRSAGRAKCDVKSGRDYKRYRDSEDEYEYQMMKKRKAKSKGRCTSDSDTDDSDDERFRKRQRRGRESESDRRRRKQKEEEKRQRRRKRKEEDPIRVEEERRRREEEKSRRREEEERRRREEEKSRRREEEERRREEKMRRDEEDREKEQQRREDERIKKEEDKRRKEEERQQREIEKKQKEEEEQRRREEEKRRRRELDNKRRQDEERRRQEEERRAKIEEERRLKNEESERKREEERIKREDEKRRREEEAERKREEQRRKAEEEKEKREEEKRRREEERQRQEEERRYKEEERKERERERKRQKEEERQRREDERREKKSRKRRRESSSGVEVCDCHRKRHCPHQSMMAAPPPPPPPQQFGGCPSRGNFGAPGYRPPGYYYPFQTYPPTSPMQSPCPFSSNCPFPQNCPLSPVHYPSGVQSEMSIPSGGGMCPCPVGGMGGMGRMCPPMGGMGGGMGGMCPPMGGMGGGMGGMCPPMGGMGGMGRMCPPMGGMGGMGRMCPMGGMGDMGGMGRMGGMGMGMGRMCPMGPGMGGMCPMGTGFGCFGTHNMVGRYYNYCYKICCKTAFCIAAVLATILIILFLI